MKPSGWPRPSSAHSPSSVATASERGRCERGSEAYASARESIAIRQSGLQLVAGFDLELAEDAGEMALHRPCRDEERLRDLPVRPALARQLGNPKLARGERIDT